MAGVPWLPVDIFRRIMMMRYCRMVHDMVTRRERIILRMFQNDPFNLRAARAYYGMTHMGLMKVSRSAHEAYEFWVLRKKNSKRRRIWE